MNKIMPEEPPAELPTGQVPWQQNNADTEEIITTPKDVHVEKSHLRGAGGGRNDGAKIIKQVK